MYARSKLKIQKAAACNHSSNMIYIFEYLQRLSHTFSRWIYSEVKVRSFQNNLVLKSLMVYFIL